MLKLWDFICENKECKYQEEFLVSLDEEKEVRECPECQGDMKRVIIGGKTVFFDKEKHMQYLKKRSKEHTARAIQEGRPLKENESGICSDPVWRNKIRTKNTSASTISQHKYDHLKK